MLRITLCSMRALLAGIEALLGPLVSGGRRPSHAAFRARLPLQEVPSEVVVGQGRDER